jgi:hypothetical protein
VERLEFVSDFLLGPAGDYAADAATVRAVAK